MRSQRLVPGLVILALGIGGMREQQLEQPLVGVVVRVAARWGDCSAVRVKLTGNGERPRGAPSGSAAAVIAIHRGSVVCWRFAHLDGFSNATAAHIHTGAKGRTGSVLYPCRTDHACTIGVASTRAAAAVKAIERDPAGYYVNIHSERYPAGAVRAQL